LMYPDNKLSTQYCHLSAENCWANS
jgi:hypothetical protein